MHSKTTLLAWMAACAILATACSSSAWAGSPDTSGASVTLRVYNYANASRTILLASETETAGILARAGITARWIDCPTSHAAWQDFPECHLPRTGADYMVSILPQAMSSLVPKTGDPLGNADDTDLDPRRAAIFYDRIRALAGGDTAPFQVLLGRVMAHEVGHLLLGRNAHARTGIMKAAWSDGELSGQAGSAMVFTAAQALRMKARIETRMAATAESSEPQLAASNLR